MTDDAIRPSGKGKSQYRQPWEAPADASCPNAGIRRTEKEWMPKSSVYIRVRRKTELILRVEREQKIVEQIVAGAIDRGLKVLASYSLPNANIWLLVVENDEVAREALDAAAIKFHVESVLLVEATPRIAAITQLDKSLRRSDINVIYSYAVPSDGDQLIAVFKTDDDNRVIPVLLSSMGDQERWVDRRDGKWESARDIPVILQEQTGA